MRLDTVAGPKVRVSKLMATQTHWLMFQGKKFGRKRHTAEESCSTRRAPRWFQGRESSFIHLKDDVSTESALALVEPGGGDRRRGLIVAGPDGEGLEHSPRPRLGNPRA